MEKLKMLICIVLFVNIYSVSAQKKSNKAVSSVSPPKKSNKALRIARVLHISDLKGRLDRFFPEDTLQYKKQASYRKEVFHLAAAEYRKQFSPEELIELVAFYTSPLGKKILKNKPKNSDTFSRFVFAFEQKQMAEQFSIVPTPN